MANEKRLIDANAYAYTGDLINEPTIDAVEVVRCKDCKHWSCWRNSGEGSGDCLLDEGYATLSTQHYDFCSYGERRTDYKSPIELLISDIQHQIVQQEDEQIYQAVLSFIPNVDKQELLLALKYDRDQYDKGYADGKTDAMASIVRCKDCKHYDNSEGICWCKLNSKFFPGGIDWHGFPEDGFCSYGERKEDG